MDLTWLHHSYTRHTGLAGVLTLTLLVAFSCRDMRMWKYGLGCVEGVHNYMIGVIESYYDWWHIIMICISTKNICCTDALLPHMLCVQRLWVVVYMYIIFSSFPSLLYSSHGVNAQLHIILDCEVRVHTICWFQQWHVVLEVSHICLYNLYTYYKRMCTMILCW